MQSLAIFIRENDITSIDRGRQVIGIASVALICPTVTLLLRNYVRLVIQKRLGKDDYLAISSFSVLASLCALLIHSCNQYNLRSSLSTLTSSSLVELTHTTYVCEILYILTTALTKFSIGFYFLRLTRKPSQRHLICATMFLVATVSIIYLFFVAFQCRPVNYLWRQDDLKETAGSCLSTRSLANITYAHASMSCLTDWMFGILPILILWKLDMKRKTKLSVMIILSLGIVASVATVVRIAEIHTLKSMTHFSWEGIGLIKWSLIEPAVALTTANIATLRPLTQRLFPSRSAPSKKRPPMLSRNAIRGLSRKSSVCYASEFADMLGLAVSPGVKTQVYAETNTDFNTPKSPVWCRWRDSQVRLVSPLLSPSHLSPSQRDTNHRSERDPRNFHWGKQRTEEERTVSLGLGSIKNGSWVAKASPSIGILKTTVVTRESGVRTDEKKTNFVINMKNL